MKNKLLKSELSSIKAKLRANNELSKKQSITPNSSGNTSSNVTVNALDNSQDNTSQRFADEISADLSTKSTKATDDEKQLFAQAIGQIKPMLNDTVRLVKNGAKSMTYQKSEQSTNKSNKAVAQFHFSDEFEPDLNKQGPMKYVREGVDSFEVKNLRRGYYRPDLILDLHGLDQNQAKKELAALLFACQKEHAQCICVVHGIGSHILKNKVPHWLVQHPDVMAFHQAPLEWGGNGAILALIELKDKYMRS